MSRLVLMNLADGDVDVLTRIAEIDPRPEVLVVHDDPEALIVRMARLASLPVAAAAPEPRPGDLVVSTPMGDVPPAWTRPWRDAGARFLAPAAVTAEALVAPAAPAVVKEAPVAPAPPAAASEPTVPASPEPPAAEAPVAAPASPRPAPVAAADEADADVFASPEATFRWLAARAVGPDAAVALWWDGGGDAWCPWVWAGTAPDAGSRPEDGALQLETRWGRFRVTGDGAATGAWNRAALVRTAEDLALRDLMGWRETETDIRRWEPVTDALPEAAVRAWMDRAWRFLRPEAAFVWRGGDPARLVAVHAPEAAFEGRLELPAALMAALFASRGEWVEWEPGRGLRAFLRFGDDDRRWPLRMKRLAATRPAGGGAAR